MAHDWSACLRSSLHRRYRRGFRWQNDRFLPYENGSEYEAQQLTFMRESLDDFTVANTMSTPMLVNDWQNPHRTCWLSLHPKSRSTLPRLRPFTTLSTERAGKVILASNSTNAQLVAEEFGVKYFDSPVETTSTRDAIMKSRTRTTTEFHPTPRNCGPSPASSATFDHGRRTAVRAP